MTNEPHVGEIQDDLDRAAGHQRQRKSQHGTLIDVSATRCVEALCRQCSADAGGWGDQFHGWCLGEPSIFAHWSLRRRSRAAP